MSNAEEEEDEEGEEVEEKAESVASIEMASIDSVEEHDSRTQESQVPLLSNLPEINTGAQGNSAESSYKVRRNQAYREDESRQKIFEKRIADEDRERIREFIPTTLNFQKLQEQDEKREEKAVRAAQINMKLFKRIFRLFSLSIPSPAYKQPVFWLWILSLMFCIPSAAVSLNTFFVTKMVNALANKEYTIVWKIGIIVAFFLAMTWISSK